MNRFLVRAGQLIRPPDEAILVGFFGQAIWGVDRLQAIGVRCHSLELLGGPGTSALSHLSEPVGLGDVLVN